MAAVQHCQTLTHSLHRVFAPFLISFRCCEMVLSLMQRVLERRVSHEQGTQPKDKDFALQRGTRPEQSDRGAARCPA